MIVYQAEKYYKKGNFELKKTLEKVANEKLVSCSSRADLPFPPCPE